MLNLGTLSALEAVVRSAGADTPAEKRQILSAVRRTLGVADDPAPAGGSRAPTDSVLTIREAADRIGKRPRTVKYLVATGQLCGLRTGRTAKLTGIPASAITAYITLGTQRTRAAAAPQEAARA